MVSNHVKFPTPVTCTIELVGTDTCVSMLHSLQYAIPFIFWDNCLVFYFQTVPCCFLNGNNSTARAKTNITANIADSVNISCCKVPLLFLSIYGIW